ncbi:unnamed protein product [Polarella glacialis]|uniref:Uncharacterized protein n=1 Tax=Polarella glacialis TaxID=89957 RepID=A0A813G2G1_POLGL|nr:unnamed protein product [Polarella glacialis]
MDCGRSEYMHLVNALLPETPGHDAICSAALLVEHLLLCSSVRMCSFAWFLLTYLHGSVLPEQYVASEVVADAWAQLHHNMSESVSSWEHLVLSFGLHGTDTAGNRRTLFRDDVGVHKSAQTGVHEDFAKEEKNAVILTSGDIDYMEEPFVWPFLEHLLCYATLRGMRFVGETRSHRGSPSRRLPGQRPQREESSAANFVWHAAWSTVGAEDAIEHLINLDNTTSLLNSVGLLLQHEDDIMLNLEPQNNWGRPWAIMAELAQLLPGALLLYFAPQFTIRPDSWHRGVVELLLNRSASRPTSLGRYAAGVIFVPDSWHGADCANTDFVAIRNTPVGERFIQLWRDKSGWAGSSVEAGFAESILEMVGVEMSGRTLGAVAYNHSCAALVLPNWLGQFDKKAYCQCWHSILETLAGPYRLRKSDVFSFVDPESLAVNFAARDVVEGSGATLEELHLVSSELYSLQPLTPFAVNWGGFGPERRQLAMDYLRLRFGFHMSGECALPPQTLALHAAFGTTARHIHCCKWRQQVSQSSTANHRPEVSSADQSKACTAYRFVTQEDCAAILAGQDIARDDVPSSTCERSDFGLICAHVSHEDYVDSQRRANWEKLSFQWAARGHIVQLARWLKSNLKVRYQFGICHGSRQGWEQSWFQQALGWRNVSVIGTEISESADDFPNTLRWDFHDVKESWVSKTDFVYTNALDHSFNPQLALRQWMKCLHEDGLLMLEHCSSHTDRHSSAAGLDDQSDVFGASFAEYLRLVHSVDLDVVEVLHAPKASPHWALRGCRVICAVRRSSGLQILADDIPRHGPRLTRGA